MSPEQFQQFQDMQQRINTLENERRAENVSNIDESLIRDVIDVTQANITRVESDSVGSEGGTVNIDTLAYPDKWLVREHKGELYLVPAYFLSKK